MYLSKDSTKKKLDTVVGGIPFGKEMAQGNELGNP